MPAPASLPADDSGSIARRLLQIGAVTLSPSQPFTWASGLLAPIYCDNRLTLGYPDIRDQIAAGLMERIDRLPGAPPDAVVGVATAGIPHATLVADRLRLPLAYVRSQAKTHGKGKQIEGQLRAGQRVVVIEDLISTGGSSLAAVDVLLEQELEVLLVASVFSYGLRVAVERFASAGIPWTSLSTLHELLAVARREDLLSVADLASLESWRDDPIAWSGRWAEPSARQ